VRPAGFDLGVNQLVLAVAGFLVLFCNRSLWLELDRLAGLSRLANAGLSLTLVVVVTTWVSLVVALVSLQPLVKPMLVALLLGAALGAYFMDTYHVLIGADMMRNVLQTDWREAWDLLSARMLVYVVFLGLVPSVGVVLLPLRRRSLLAGLRSRVSLMAVLAAVLVLAAWSHYRDLSMLLREHREIRFLVNPAYPLYALVKAASEQGESAARPAPAAIEHDAAQAATAVDDGRRTLVVLVVGETARAANFSLNGYERETTPELAAHDVINFPRTRSCGTSTAVSLPCMFSSKTREQYRDGDADREENLLDVIEHAGVAVLWRDNDSGCKHSCDRVPHEDLEALQLADLCGSDECFDDVLLYRLQDYLDGLDRDALVVLHQKGSHGPAYYKRVPDAFRVFLPECTSNGVPACSREQIVNSYDNTIRYTDHVLARAIDFLAAQSSRFDTALVYMSDHGESLGESGIYLHGMPYVLAPEDQVHVPFLIWMSSGFARQAGIDRACVRAVAGDTYSHDNLFHTLLGMLRVRTAVYDGGYDLLARCRAVAPESTADFDRRDRR
jgi:lipid A ethanolaminephosphotransferase